MVHAYPNPLDLNKSSNGCGSVLGNRRTPLRHPLLPKMLPLQQDLRMVREDYSFIQSWALSNNSSLPALMPRIVGCNSTSGIMPILCVSVPSG